MIIGAQTVYSIIDWARERFWVHLSSTTFAIFLYRPYLCLLPFLMRLPSQQCAKKAGLHGNITFFSVDFTEVVFRLRKTVLRHSTQLDRVHLRSCESWAHAWDLAKSLTPHLPSLASLPPT